MQQPSPPLADPFARIFTDRAEADWAFDLLRDTARRLDIQGAYDPRFAITLARRSGRLGLHLNFGGWLVIGFHGPGQSPAEGASFPNLRVDLALLADQVSWDERFNFFPFAPKEGEREVRSYHLPLETIRPMTSDLAAAYETTLDFIAHKFQRWKRASHWQQHNPEIAEALFKPEQRERLFAGLLNEPELRYERHLTAFYQDVSEEPEAYNVEEVEAKAEAEEIVDSEEVLAIEYPSQKGINMTLVPDKIEKLIMLMQQYIPDWNSFSDLYFVKDEIEYKQVAIAQAQDLLSESELRRLITEGEFEEFIKRLEKIGKSTNLLFLGVPRSGDLNILYHSKLDKPTFCEAIFGLLYGLGSSPERLDRYLNYVEAEQLPNKWTFPTYFLFICHPDTEMFVKPQTMKWFMKFFDSQDKYTSNPTSSTYATIRQMVQQLRVELHAYGPHDMVDIQSLIWICYRQPIVEQGYDTNETKLAEPFSQIFIDRREAEWALDFLQEAFKRLDIKNPDDPRFAITLARRFGGLNLHFNLGNWLVLGFRGPNLRRERVRLPLFTEQIDFEQYPETFNIGQELDFAQNPAEPQIVGYGLPIEPVKSMEDNLQIVYEATLDYIAQRFRHYDRCPWRNKHHVPEIAEAIFNTAKRAKLLTNGLSKEIEAIIEADKNEDSKIFNEIVPLPQLAANTGLDEAELTRWVRAIERKGQAILYGPPGTGKTFVAEKLAAHLVGGGDGFVELVQFHPAYAYEDFIQGIRPHSEGDHLSYPLVPGRFLEFCARAGQREGRCVLIVDEINRANLSRVFGELMYLLEYRNRAIPLAGGGLLQIPTNVRLIGTMNTADRSIALVDHALRRRFAFIALYPNYDMLRRYHQKTGFPVEGLIDSLTSLNRAIGDRHYEVGVAFFLRPNLAGEIEDIWRMEIEPYLEEYFFDRPEQADTFRWDKVKAQLGRDWPCRPVG